MLDKIIEQVNEDIMTLETVLSVTPEAKDFNDVAWLQFCAGRLQSSLRILKMFDESKYNELREKSFPMSCKATQLVYGKQKSIKT